MDIDEAGVAALAIVGTLADIQRDIPRIARHVQLTDALRQVTQQVSTKQRLIVGDARRLTDVASGSVHLVVTSPPYWTLKTYNDTPGQLGHVADYDQFLGMLDEVWRDSFRVLVPGGRLVIVVGDVCLSRRQNNGRHTVVSLHSSIAERCRKIGFDGLAPIIWHKIANAVFEADGNGAGFLGKPYEPNAVIKNDIEFLLMQRKPGGYRSPSLETRLLSLIAEEDHRAWFQQIWTGIHGASTRAHPAPFPLELAARLIRMFSFAGDTVLDPFVGTGTTLLAASQWGRNGIGVEVDPDYADLAVDRLRREMPAQSALSVAAGHSVIEAA
jgi:DNA modification methylase